MRLSMKEVQNIKKMMGYSVSPYPASRQICMDLIDNIEAQNEELEKLRGKNMVISGTEKLTMDEIEKIKADWNHPLMCKNDFWDKRINSLFDTIEVQQQEIKQLRALVAITMETLKKAREALIHCMTSAFQYARALAGEALAAIDKALGSDTK